MRKLIQDFHRARRGGATMRPIWQIAILAPVALVAWAATVARDWLDDKFNPVNSNFWSDDDA